MTRCQGQACPKVEESGTADWTTILDAATPGEPGKPTRQTVAHYREHLLRLFVLDPVEARQPAFAPPARLTVAAKHPLVDPALAARLVGVGKAGLLTGDGTRPTTVTRTTGTWLGALFESLATPSVRVYADALGDGALVGHLRTKNAQHEVDLIVHRPDLSYVATKVKFAPTVTNHDVRHLNWLPPGLTTASSTGSCSRPVHTPTDAATGWPSSRSPARPLSRARGGPAWWHSASRVVTGQQVPVGLL